MNVKSWMIEDERFARSMSTISIVLFSRLSHSICEYHFGDLRTASGADHMLICAKAFFTFTDSHKSVRSQRVLLTHLSWWASSAQQAVKIFFLFRHSAFDLNILNTASLPEKSTPTMRAKVFGSVFQWNDFRDISYSRYILLSWLFVDSFKHSVKDSVLCWARKESTDWTRVSLNYFKVSTTPSTKPLTTRLPCRWKLPGCTYCQKVCMLFFISYMIS
jgi:hypothetical protein